MRSLYFSVYCCLALMAAGPGTASSADGLPAKAETWRSEYPDQDATGPHVLGLWQFLAVNDVPGLWELRVRELASGKTASGYFRVRKQ